MTPQPLTVVCFGDSLTWGFNPADKSRYGHDIRWTRCLQKELGEAYYVVEEGINGRTTVFEDPVRGDKNGLQHLAGVRKTHMPIDVLIIMLGSNDLQDRFSMSADAIGLAMGRILYAALQATDDVEGRAPKVLLMAPPPLGDFTGKEYAGVYSNAHGGVQSRRLAGVYRNLAEDYGVAFFDTGTVISASPIDAIHFEAEPQADLARAVADEVRKLAEA
ncbi:SGNH/GDSL hydrolase family protein [Roseibium sediminicola]|uniref:SGNH/GDSL hydrolase family protein n=1 Tax=Roseibium sediminicola TaxID=2933272 RepID=A0ABT0GY95_9HYPH|nr:SGNH/GDSL hydrolase family protein [Roseibium sp. CAU 1639]MCK7614407.1 SGNH/GDSL hydrolase family protein [Roseibium sp. CAU 1639]